MYAQILPIVLTYNPILGVTLRLLPRFTADSTMQGGEGKGGKQFRQFLSQEQAQYLTDDHLGATHFSRFFRHLRVPQLILLRRSPPPPPLAS